MKNLIVALVFVLGTVPAVWADADRVITTMGQGVVEAVPDMATINLGVTNEARLAGDALRLTSDAVAAVLAQLNEAGIAPRDMQTQGVSLQPVWNRRNPENETPRITGFVARNTLTIRVRDLDTLGGILDRVVQDGANTFNGLQFSIQDPEPAIAAARQDAVKDAIAKAEQLAEAAGVALGPVQSISESGGGGRPVVMEMASARMASDVPVAAGEVSLTARVSMVFEILD
ncbi:SIMPL domain-containing protein [Roseobacter litoralis]|uniref:SIMPL domain-containing protein n=1 Tax=Roseobacter litoralis TaxID=42443 RepID=UPI00249125D7|nr:SIMPL domain-containing protein [Roseobacter litoralis]